MPSTALLAVRVHEVEDWEAVLPSTLRAVVCLSAVDCISQKDAPNKRVTDGKYSILKSNQFTPNPIFGNAIKILKSMHNCSGTISFVLVL